MLEKLKQVKWLTILKWIGVVIAFAIVGTVAISIGSVAVIAIGAIVLAFVSLLVIAVLARILLPIAILAFAIAGIYYLIQGAA